MNRVYLDRLVRPVSVPREKRRRTRGQSLVEFALVLPILLLIVAGTLDIARVYLGWINLQSMTRIGANYAATNPDAWGSSPNGVVQATYRAQVIADATTTNCELPQSGGAPDVAAPSFNNMNGGGIGLGDTVTVALTCQFTVVTPVLSSVVGNAISVSAESTFPVKAGLSAVAGGGGSGGGGGVEPTSAFMGNSVVANESTTPTVSGVDSGSGFVVDFRDTSGGMPTSWQWGFGDGNAATVRDPGNHTYRVDPVNYPTQCSETACTYRATMQASNGFGPGGTASMNVVVLAASDVDFAANPASGDKPLVVSFTNASSPGGTAFNWTFGDGGTSTSENPSHTYSAPGAYDVTLTVTYPAPVGDKSLTMSSFISVGWGTCTVPSLNGVRFNSAQGVWTGAGFAGAVTRGPGAPNGNFTITAQSLTSGDQYTCNLGVEVSAP